MGYVCHNQFRNSSICWWVFAIRCGGRSRSFWRTSAATTFHGTGCGWNHCLNCAIRFHCYFTSERASNEVNWYHIRTGWQPHVVRIHLLRIGDIVYISLIAHFTLVRSPPYCSVVLFKDQKDGLETTEETESLISGEALGN